MKSNRSSHDVRFGNPCNPKCSMCGPTDSSMWYEDSSQLWGDSYKDSLGKVKLIKNPKRQVRTQKQIYTIGMKGPFIGYKWTTT